MLLTSTGTNIQGIRMTLGNRYVNWSGTRRGTLGPCKSVSGLWSKHLIYTRKGNQFGRGLGLLNTKKHCFLNFTRQYLFIIYSGATLKVPWWAKILTFPPQDLTYNQSLSFISLSETRSIPPPFYTGVSASPSTAGKGIEKQGTYLAGSIQNLWVSAQSALTSN